MWERTAKQLLRQLRAMRLAQGRKVEHGHALDLPILRIQHGLQRAGRTVGFRPARDQEQQWHSIGERQQMLEQFGRRRVRPMPVFQHEQGRSLAAEALEQQECRAENLVAHRQRIECLDPFCQYLGQWQCEQRARIRQQVARFFSEETIHALIELGPARRLAIGLQNVERC
jgi:hypothetical protein